ncbi:MAG: 4Fe-4S dicluster domain-containing protein [Planctomycetota bacterium]|jgi:carbon-monoxide dehydrogenase iron sulfur subunit
MSKPKKRFTSKLCVTCKRCMIECAVRHSQSQDMVLSSFEDPAPVPRIYINFRKDKPHATYCQNCKKPKCRESCEYGAITKFEDGNVIIDQEKCTGCWACIDACPFGAITKEAEMAVAFNCDDCKGYDDMACVEACKTSSLHYVEKKTVVTAG